MSDILQFEANSAASDRRLYARHRVLLSCLALNEDNGGIVLDISEQGLAMQAAKTLETGCYTQLRFQLSQFQNWVEAKGRIAWISSSKQTAGVEFVDLSYDSLVFIKNWISSIETLDGQDEDAIPLGGCSSESLVGADEEASFVISEPAFPGIAGEELVQELITDDLICMLPRIERASAEEVPEPASEKLQVVTDNVRSVETFEGTLFPQQLGEHDQLITTGSLHLVSQLNPRIGQLAGVALLLLIVLFLGYSLRKSANGQSGATVTAAAPLQVTRDSSASSSLAPPPPDASRHSSGFILQVAAANDENSAIALAEVLRQKGFPVFVFQPPGAKFYRVLVGPYGDTDAAVKVEAELKKQGFDVIRKRNTPAP